MQSLTSSIEIPKDCFQTLIRIQYIRPFGPRGGPAGYVYLFMLSDGTYESALSLGNGKVRWSFPVSVVGKEAGVVDTSIDEIRQMNPNM